MTTITTRHPLTHVRAGSLPARAWRRSFLLELSADAGAADPPRPADQLMLLYVGAGMDRDSGAAATARAAAKVLLDAATGA